MNSRKQKKLRWITICPVFLCLIAFVAARSAAGAPAESAKPAYIGGEQCLSCHDGADAAVKATKHSILFDESVKGESGKGCEACHGAGEQHLDDPEKGVLRFNGSDAWKESSACLKCHSGEDRNGWHVSRHSQEGMSCAKCHSAHGKLDKLTTAKKKDIPALLVNTELELCLSCHEKKIAEINMPSHMPIKQGRVSCSDCHSPHNNSQLEMDRAAKVCVECHQEKAGPFLFEHNPVSESCTLCHDPHGSINQNLTKLRQPALCLQCHAIGLSHSPDPLEKGKRCTACHEPHGSNSSPQFQKLRSED